MLWDRVGIASRPIRELRHFRAFFPEIGNVVAMPHRSFWVPRVEAVAGWGHKPTAARMRAYAARHGVPYLALEDGLVRSYDLGVRGARPWSLVLDRQGIYYDATQASDMEQAIAQATSAPIKDAVASSMHAMRTQRISKYNSGPMRSAAQLGLPAQPFVLLVDQCLGDASVPLGLADETSFAQMLARAQALHPTHRIVIKTHPDVLTGARQGYLTRLPVPADALVIADAVNPWCLLEHAQAVHVVTSLLGMEALLAGCEVHCHGVPFYAGWGLTQDHHSPETVARYAPRRSARPSLLQLFAAAYHHYPRYVNPYSGTRETLMDAIERIVWLRAQEARRPTRVHALGFSGWKQPHVRPFLAPTEAMVQFHATPEAALAAAQADAGSTLAVWAAKESASLAADCAARAVPLLRVEDGFIRSVGLGSDLRRAHSLVLDAVGIYFDASQPSGLEARLMQPTEDVSLLARAAALRQSIVQHGISKYNLGAQAAAPSVPLPHGKQAVLVVGQVESDASIARGAVGVRSNADLLRAARACHPEAWLIYKPHPDVLSGNRQAGEADRDASALADAVVTDQPLAALFGCVTALHTITSLAGFEALLHGVAVHTHGVPFYAGWGLTHDHAPAATPALQRRTAQVSLDQLVAATLLEYPCYYDWDAGLLCTPEHTLQQLLEQRALPIAPRQKTRFRQVRRLMRWLQGVMR